MIPTLLANWRVILLAALITSNAMTFGLWRHSTNALVSYRAEVKALGEAQERHTREVIETQKQITEDTTNGWKASVDYLRAHPVRLPSQPSGRPVPGVSIPAPRPDETRAYPIPAAAELAAGCAETTNQLNFLQGWIEQQRNLK